jgi:hypothetical protein
MSGELAELGAGRTLMFVLTSSGGLREFIRNSTSKAMRGMIVSSRITVTPSRVKRRWVRPLPVFSRKNNSNLLPCRGVLGLS